MTNWKKHTGTSMPSELAGAQIVEMRDDVSGAIWEPLPACSRDWQFTEDISYRSALDPDGIPYCSAEGLESWVEYVAVEECEIGGQRVLQFKGKPQRVKPSLIAPERWDDGSDNGRTDAPETHRKPGDPADSLMRVWRE